MEMERKGMEKGKGFAGSLSNCFLCGATENARLELSAPNCRGRKCGTKQLWKAKTPAGLEVSLLLLTCYGSHNMIYQIICPNLQFSVFLYISCMYVCITVFISVLLYYTL